MTKRKTLAKPSAHPLGITEPPPGREVERIAESLQRWIDRRPPVNVMVTGEGREFQVVSPHTDERGHMMRMADAFGSRSGEFIGQQLGALETAGRPMDTRRGGTESAKAINAGLALVEAVRPENELEAALAVQMAQTHALSIELMGRAKSTDRVDHMETYANLAVKMQRTFTGQIEALARMRGKGQQTVRVEHVTVEAGAQAIVGDVHHHPGGPGPQSKIGNQSHAQTAHAPVAALSGPDPLGNGVPITGNEGEAPMSHARRNEPRRRRRQP